MKHILFFLALILFSLNYAFAQNNSLMKFEKTEHDYGTIEEEKTPKADYTFSFTNISGVPIKLLNAKASCGCTTPSWSQEIIQPNQKGYVMASYNAKNRPGKFNKTVTVTAAKVSPKTSEIDSASKDIRILRISGEVVPRPKGPEDWYPFEEGNIRYSTNHIAFGNLTEKDIKNKEIVIFNQGTKPVTISKVENKPVVKVEFIKNQKTVQPNDSIKLKVTYDATQVNDWDWQHERVFLHTDDDTIAKKTLYVSASISPYFPEMTKADSLQAAKISFDKMTHDFGEIVQGETANTEFKFTNTGKSELKILKTKASCGCTATKPDKTLLQPGESSVIKVSFNSTGKKDKQMKNITVITNDPAKPSIKLNIKAFVKEKGH